MKKENLILIERAIQHPEVVNLVSRESERIWHKVKDVTSFENTCYRNIGKALMNEEVRSVGGIALRIIKRAAAWHIKNRGIDKDVEVKSIEALAGLDDEGEEITHEIPDVLANVEWEVMKDEVWNEKVALLAKGDKRRITILNAWYSGYFNALELSRILANTFGGTNSAHRKAIQRFKTEVEGRLASAL